MAGYKVSLKMPVVALRVDGEYSRFKKPTGLENLILTAIGTSTLNSDTWREFFSRIAVPGRMIPLFKKVIDSLNENGVILMDEFNPDDRISEVMFTETGRNLFEKGRIKKEPKAFQRDVYYIPYAKAENEQFLFSINASNDADFDSFRFRDVLSTFDKDDLLNYLTRNKKHLGADKEDEILTIDPGEPTILCVKKDVSLQFDDTSGNFYFESVVDSNFIKGHYTADDLITALDDIRENPKNMTLKAVSTVPDEWTSVKYDLPKDFTLKGKFCVVNTELCKTEHPAIAAEGLGCAFADIDSDNKGRAYLLVNEPVSISGLKGTVDIPVLVSRSLSKEEIIVLFDKISATVDLTDYDSVMAFLNKSVILNDADYQLRMVKKHLDATANPTGSLVKLSDVKTNWVKGLPTVIEQHMYDSDKSIDMIVGMLEASSFKLECESLADKFRTDDLDKNLIVADKLFKVSKSPVGIAVKLDVNNHIAEAILNGGKGDYGSTELQAVNIASSKLSELKRMFAVETPDKYDVSAFNGSETETMASYEALAKAMTVVKPLIRGTEGEKRLEEYLNLFQNLNEIYGKDVPLERLNGYQFGIGIRRKTETVLRSILKTSEMLAGLINEASKKQVISDDELKTLEKIKSYGNDCAHTTNVPPIDSKEKQRWIRTVNEIEKRNKGKNK